MLVAEEGVNEDVMRCKKFKQMSGADRNGLSKNANLDDCLSRVKVTLKHALISFCATNFNGKDENNSWPLNGSVFISGEML